MTITLPLAPLGTFIAEHPWAVVALVLLLGVLLPAVWSRHSWRRAAAADLTHIILDAATRIAKILRRDDRR